MGTQCIKPYVKTNKNAAAEAVCEAVVRPNMRFVQIKNIEQQAVLPLHRVLQGSVCWRRLQIDPVCRFHVTQRDDLEPVGGQGIAATKGGAVKSRRLGHICVGANTTAVKEAP